MKEPIMRIQRKSPTLKNPSTQFAGDVWVDGIASLRMLASG
jgi:hypothetical protein